MGYSVRNNDLLEFAAVEGFDGIAAQDAVGDDRKYILSAFGDQHICSLNKRTASVRHVVDQDAGLALDVSDQYHS